jgi:hypothetical protein
MRGADRQCDWLSRIIAKLTFAKESIRCNSLSAGTLCIRQRIALGRHCFAHGALAPAAQALRTRPDSGELG